MRLLQQRKRVVPKACFSGSPNATPHLGGSKLDLEVEGLEGHPDPVVAIWAQDALRVMRQLIEHDRSIDFTPEQSFE